MKFKLQQNVRLPAELKNELVFSVGHFYPAFGWTTKHMRLTNIDKNVFGRSLQITQWRNFA